MTSGWICSDCGNKFGKYRNELLGSTWHHDKCDWCGEEKPVTESRDYGLPVAPKRNEEGDKT